MLGLLLLPGVEACQSCPGVPFLQPDHMATVAGALLSFATINARGRLFADNAMSLKDIAAAMLRHEIHAVSVTETNSFAIQDASAHWRREQQHSRQLEKQHGIKVISASTKSRVGRTAILLHDNLAQFLPPTPAVHRAVDGRYLQVALHPCPGTTLSLLSIYGDACETSKRHTQRRLIEATEAHLSELDLTTRDMVILQGDINEVRLACDTDNPTRALDEEGLLDWLDNEPSMVDLYRVHHPDTPAFTFTTATDDAITHSRLDYIYVSTNFLQPDKHAGALIDECGALLTTPRQDHRAVVGQVPHPVPQATAPHPLAPPPGDGCF